MSSVRILCMCVCKFKYGIVRINAPVGKCTRNSRTSDCIRRLRFGRSYSKRYIRYGPPRTGAYRRRDSRLCRHICIHRRRMTRIARSRGTEKDSSSNRTARIDRPPCYNRDYRCIRNASLWDDRCNFRSPRSQNSRCTRLENENKMSCNTLTVWVFIAQSKRTNDTRISHLK